MLAQQELGRQATRNRYRSLHETGNRPMLKHEQLRGELSRQVADYLAAVRDREQLPPHAFPAGFFMDAFPASEIAELSKVQDAAMAPLVPVAAIDQRTGLTDPTVLETFSLQTMPDFGRRVQLWWDELAPGHAPLRSDEAIRFIRRVEWLGRVDEIQDDRFAATVWDRSHPGSVEQAEFFLAQLAPYDRARLAPGADFYWTVGYVENAFGERTGASRVRLKRVRASLPPELLREADAMAREVVKLFDLPSPPSQTE